MTQTKYCRLYWADHDLDMTYEPHAIFTPGWFQQGLSDIRGPQHVPDRCYDRNQANTTCWCLFVWHAAGQWIRAGRCIGGWEGGIIHTKLLRTISHYTMGTGDCHSRNNFHQVCHISVMNVSPGPWTRLRRYHRVLYVRRVNLLHLFSFVLNYTDTFIKISPEISAQARNVHMEWPVILSVLCRCLRLVSL